MHLSSADAKKETKSAQIVFRCTPSERNHFLAVCARFPGLSQAAVVRRIFELMLAGTPAEAAERLKTGAAEVLADLAEQAVRSAASAPGARSRGARRKRAANDGAAR